MKKPGWLRNAVATAKGYVSEKGEILKRKNLTQAEIDEWNGKKAKKAEAPVEEAAAEEAPKKKKSAPKVGSKIQKAVNKAKKKLKK